MKSLNRCFSFICVVCYFLFLNVFGAFGVEPVRGNSSSDGSGRVVRFGLVDSGFVEVE